MDPVISTDEPTDWSLLPGWLTTTDAQRWKQLLEHGVAWEQPLVQVFGKYHRVPRKTVFLAEQGLQYRYSGAIHVGEGWPEWFHPLLEQVNHIAQAQFNGCLLNLYRDGDDRMGWHPTTKRKSTSHNRLHRFRWDQLATFYSDIVAIKPSEQRSHWPTAIYSSCIPAAKSFGCTACPNAAK